MKGPQVAFVQTPHGAAGDTDQVVMMCACFRELKRCLPGLQHHRLGQSLFRQGIKGAVDGDQPQPAVDAFGALIDFPWIAGTAQ